jgi:hypothetical protein
LLKVESRIRCFSLIRRGHASKTFLKQGDKVNPISRKIACLSSQNEGNWLHASSREKKERLDATG